MDSSPFISRRMSTKQEKECQELVCKAECAFHALRWDEMVALLKQVLEIVDKPSEGHMQMMMVAYRHAVNARRDAVRVLSALRKKAREQRGEDEPKSEYDLPVIDTYLKTKVCPELHQLCTEFLAIIDERFLPNIGPWEHESRVLLCKTKADYYRYIVEMKKALGVKTDDIPELWMAYDGYKAAITCAKAHLPDNNTKLLGAYLNATVFLYEIHGEPEQAAKMAREAFNRSDRWYHQDEDVYLFQQLLRENAETWDLEIEAKREAREKSRAEFAALGSLFDEDEDEDTGGCYPASSEDDGGDEKKERSGPAGDDDKKEDGEVDESAALSAVASTAVRKSTASLEGNVSEGGNIDEEYDIDPRKLDNNDGDESHEKKGDTSRRNEEGDTSGRD